MLAAAALGATALAAPASTPAAPYVPRQVIVGYAPATTSAERQAIQEAVETTASARVAPHTRLLEIGADRSVASAAAELRSQPGVLYAVPNYRARAAGGFLPNDPGSTASPGGWRALQWDFLGAPSGIDAPDAWSNLIAARRPGAGGVTVAVIDSGVAYTTRGAYRRSPDFSANQFVSGYDFVDHDRVPIDENGHGTFVAGLIAARTNNRVALAGLAYNARIMPLRVLDRQGYGDAARIGEAIRYAVDHRAQVINLSIEFDPTAGAPLSASEIPGIASAVTYAVRHGVLIVAAGGNEGLPGAAFPARLPGVLGIGATTERGCAADYSNWGPGIDLVAPGGGTDADLAADPACRPGSPGRDIYGLTFSPSAPGRFLLRRAEGTSVAAPHAAAAAAMVIASGVLGVHPSAARLTRWLRAKAHRLGAAGGDPHYGAGLLDVGAATIRRR